MSICEREGCESPGHHYLITQGVVHTNVPTWATLSIATRRRRDITNGSITLCAEHAMADLGVAIP